MTTLNLPLAGRHEIALLHEHMLRCALARGPLHRLHCFAESVHAFLAPRFVTTLALTLIVIAGATFAG
jgi:hypothetical protein